MWSRVVEIMLGCWLAMSPFIFHHAADNAPLWINDFSCALGVMVLAMISWWQPTRHAHVGISGIGLWLIVFAYFNYGEPMPAALQNNFLVGLLLIMFGVIPNSASRPPESWYDYDAKCESSRS